MSEYHKPVMLHECLEGLNINPNGVYADVTFGGGGHSMAILQKLDSGKLFAFDQDEDAKINLPEDKNLIFCPHNFRYIQNFLEFYQVEKLDGLLADLGISSHQINEPDRGFSYRFDTALDMRMNRNSALTAAWVFNTYSDRELARVFNEFGEIRSAWGMAKKISNSRSSGKIETVGQLLGIIAEFLPKGKENKVLSQVFQAVRIEVNLELTVLEELLESLPAIIKKGGRIVFMSYHSKEDRLVKNFIQTGNVQGKPDKDFFGNLIVPFKSIHKKAIAPSEQEIENNPRSRSAKLRIAERL